MSFHLTIPLQCCYYRQMEIKENGFPPMEQDARQILQKYVSWLMSWNGWGEMEAHTHMHIYAHRQHNNL
jgi:hypothetical protein